MLGIIIQLAISYLLLKFLANRNLTVLGFYPTTPRLKNLAAGILWPVVYFCSLEFCLAALVHNPYRVNTAFHFNDFINTLGYLLRAVVYEELIFRGALLYILMQKIDGHKAVIISAVCFGVYHWFAWQAWGNPLQMAAIFFETATVGYLMALSFLRTRSMYLGFALHFGANLVNILIFSKDKSIGLQLLVKSFEKDPVVPPSIISVPVLVIYFIGFQVLTYLLFFKSNLVINNS